MTQARLASPHTDQEGAGVASALEIVVSYAENTLDVRHLVGQKSFIIGEGKAVDFTVASDELPASEFPLIRCIDGHYVLTFMGEQRGEIERDGVFRPLQWLKTETKPDEQLPGCFRYPLPVGERATVRLGNLVISVRHVTPPDRVEEQQGQRDLRYSAAVLVISTLLALALGAALLVSYRPEAAEMKSFWLDNPRVARLLGQAEPKLPVRTPNVVLDPSPVVVGLDAGDAAVRIAAEGQALSDCASSLYDGSGIRATLTVTHGKVTSVQTEALSRDQGEEGLSCVREVLSGVTFSAGDGRVVYTLGVNRR